MRDIFFAAVLLMSLGAPVSSAAHGAGIGEEAPPPPVLLITPRFVAVPQSAVMHAPSATFNLFAFHGRYYSFHNGAWFAAGSHKGPWVQVTMDKVPFAVRAVPLAYYKILPGRGSRLRR